MDRSVSPGVKSWTAKNVFSYGKKSTSKRCFGCKNLKLFELGAWRSYPRTVNRSYFHARDSTAYDHHVINSKSSKFLQHKLQLLQRWDYSYELNNICYPYKVFLVLDYVLITMASVRLSGLKWRLFPRIGSLIISVPNHMTPTLPAVVVKNSQFLRKPSVAHSKLIFGIVLVVIPDSGGFSTRCFHLSLGLVDYHRASIWLAEGVI